MSDEKWAVYLDYGLSEACAWHDAFGGTCLHSTVLGGSISDRYQSCSEFIGVMQTGGSGEFVNAWDIDEDDLPYGYTFQTYYVARYYGADIEKGVTA